MSSPTEPFDPEISVVINCFNGEKYLFECLKSVQNQSFRNFEVVFIDNCSFDKTAKIFNKFASDIRFKYFRTKKKISLASARNFALRKIEGEFIAFLDSDDTWDRNKLKIQVNDFGDSKVGISASNYLLINERKDFKITKKDCLKEFDDKDQINSLLLNYDIHISTLMFRKKILESMTYFFDKRFNIIEDFDFVLRLSRSARIKINKNFLATYRWHSNNLGLRTNFKVGEEFFLWKNQPNIKENFSELNNYKFFLQRSMWLYAIYLVLSNKKRRIILILNYLNFSKKLKLLILLFIPKVILKFYLKNKI